MKEFIKIICIILLIGGAILSSCILAGEDATALPTASAAITAIFSRPTTFIATEGTPSPSTEVTASLPPSSSTIQIPSAPSAATWVPALSESEAEGVAIDLLRTNGGCRLPCFWGFVPRQVNLETLDSFFHAFYTIGGQNINIPSDNSAIKISVTWNYSDNPHEVARWLHVVMASEREVKLADGKYNQNVFDNPYFHQYIQYYTLTNLLSNYGSPSKGYIGIDPAAQMGGEDLYHLYLDYSRSGWSVHFWMPLKREDEFYIGCPTQAFISLETWLPGDSATESENLARIRDYGIFRPFEDMTSLTLEEFYQQFKDPLNTKCLRTPMDKW